MASESSQAFIKRNRPPRVHITYADPYDADKQVEIPFVMGVMADLSGNAPGKAKADFADRAFLDVDMDNFENRMAAIEPGITFRVDNRLGDGDDKLSVSLTFSKMDDFSPAAIARQVPALAALLEARTRLANLMRYMDGKVGAEEALKKLLSDPKLMELLKDRQAGAPASSSNEVGEVQE